MKSIRLRAFGGIGGIGMGNPQYRGNKITSVVFLEGVQSLESWSFQNNPIASIVIPPSLAGREKFKDAFADAWGSKPPITSITLPANVDESNMNQFETGLVNYWKSQNKKAGTYKKIGQLWTVE